MVSSGAITVGELTSFFIYTAYVGSSLTGLSAWYSEMNKGVGASLRLFNLLDSQSKIETTVGQKQAIKGSIRFENVTFSYPTRPDHPILNNLSFELARGQSVAIVGHSGSGKSTIAQFLLRFYDADIGNVYIDDVPIQKFDPVWLRDKIVGLVSQEPVLFATSIKENIRYGRPGATDAEVIEASKKANAHEFITDFPNQYDTQCGERGSALSGEYF